MSTLAFFSIWIFVLGLCIGSFLNVCICRLPRHESLLHPPSHCPQCGHAIRAWENVPVISYLFLRGRCSGCTQPISLRYPLVELATGVLFVLLWHRLWQTGAAPVAALPVLVLAAMLLVVALTDIEHGMIPNMVTLPGAAAGLALALLLPAVRTPLLWGSVQDSVWDALLLDTISVPDRFAAFVLALVGALLGGGLLLLIRELGRVLWGRARMTGENAHTLTVSTAGLIIDDDDPRPFDALLPRRSDCVIVELAEAPANTTLAETFATGDRVRITRTGVKAPDGVVSFDKLGDVTLRSRRWWQPREVLGLGDIKLAALLGAFLGITGVFFSLMVSALIGTVFGVLALAGTRGRTGAAVPFGPFLAGGGMVWLFAGPEILHWYSRLLG